MKWRVCLAMLPYMFCTRFIITAQQEHICYMKMNSVVLRALGDFVHIQIPDILYNKGAG